MRRLRLRTGASEAAACALTSAAAEFSRLRGRQEGACGGIGVWETRSGAGQLQCVGSLPSAGRDEPWLALSSLLRGKLEVGFPSVLGQVWVVPEPVGLRSSHCCQYQYFNKVQRLVALLWSMPQRCLSPKFMFFPALTRRRSPWRSPSQPLWVPRPSPAVLGPGIRPPGVSLGILFLVLRMTGKEENEEQLF